MRAHRRVFDSFLVAAGWVTYKAGLFSDYLAPYWIITMWMLFATTLNVSMRWLRGKPWLAAFFGCFGGPTTYLAGQKLGGIVLLNQICSSAGPGHWLGDHDADADAAVRRTGRHAGQTSQLDCGARPMIQHPYLIALLVILGSRCRQLAGQRGQEGRQLR